MSKRRPVPCVSGGGIDPRKRKCAYKGCITILAASNPGPLCIAHQCGQRLAGGLRDLLDEVDLLSTMRATRLDDDQGFLSPRTFHGRQADDTGSLFHIVRRWQDHEGLQPVLEGGW